MPTITDTQKISRRVQNTIAAGQTLSFSGYSNTFYIISTTGQLRIKTNTGISALYDGKKGVKTYEGNPFDVLEVSNETTQAITFDLFYGFGEFIDNSNTNTGATDTVSTNLAIVATGVPQLLADSDASRSEIWLWTDETNNLAWWAESAARLASPANYQKIGQNLDGFTKLKTKAPIWVVAAAGVNIGGIILK